MSVLVQSSLYLAQLSIDELGLQKQHSVPDALDLEELEGLHACAQSIKKCVDLFFSAPPSMYPIYSFPFYSQLGHCLTLLYRCTAMESRLWDRDAVRKTVDVLEVADRLVANLGKVRGIMGHPCVVEPVPHPDDDVFAHWAKLIRRLRTQWEEELGELVRNRPGNMVSPESLVEQPVMMEMVDEAWLMDFFASWD